MHYIANQLRTKKGWDLAIIYVKGASQPFMIDRNAKFTVEEDTDGETWINIPAGNIIPLNQESDPANIKFGEISDVVLHISEVVRLDFVRERPDIVHPLARKGPQAAQLREEIKAIEDNARKLPSEREGLVGLHGEKLHLLKPDECIPPEDKVKSEEN